MEALTHICQFYFTDFVSFETKFVNESIYEVIQDMSLKFNDTLLECMWQYEYDNCSKFFAPLLTEAGVCFSFNALNSHEMYTDE